MKGLARKLLIALGALLIVTSVVLIAYALISQSPFSMATFSGIVIGIIILMLGLIKPTTHH